MRASFRILRDMCLEKEGTNPAGSKFTALQFRSHGKIILKQGSVQDPADEGLGEEADSNSFVIFPHGFAKFVGVFSCCKVKGRVAALESEIKKWKLEALGLSVIVTS